MLIRNRGLCWWIIMVMSSVIALIAVSSIAFSSGDEAFAQNELITASQQHETSIQATQSQAKKVGVWVIDKFDNYMKYSYNKKGLISKDYGGKLGTTNRYFYKGTKLVKYTHRPNSLCPLRDSYDRLMTYDKQGRLTKLVSKYTYVEGGVSRQYNHCAIKYIYKKGGKVVVSGSWDMGKTKKMLYFSKGKLVKVVDRYSDFRGVWSDLPTTTYSYYTRGPAKGYLKKQGDITYKYFFNKRGCLTKITPSSGFPIKFSYKKIMVPKVYVKSVRKQQRVLQSQINDFSISWALAG